MRMRIHEPGRDEQTGEIYILGRQSEVGGDFLIAFKDGGYKASGS